MLATTAAAALVALAAVMLAGNGDPTGATPSAGPVLPAALPAAAAAAAAVPSGDASGGAELDGADAAAPDSTDPTAAPTVAPSPSAKGRPVSSRTAARVSHAKTTAVRPAAPKTPTPTDVDGTPCTSTAKACVDVADREAWLIDKGVVTRGPVQIMTGDNDDPTPIGTFRVQWKAEQYTSRTYLTQMPYSVFFADGGVAFHEGPQDTYSAGCVKLVHDDAVAFFNDLQVGDEVQVH